MYIWGKGRAEGRVGSGRVRLFVGNRGSGRVNVCGSGRVGSKKSDPWTTLIQYINYNIIIYILFKHYYFSYVIL